MCCQGIHFLWGAAVVSQADLRKERTEALARLLDQIDSTKIEIDRLDIQVVRHRAVVWWNTNRGHMSREFISPLATNEMIDRVTVNFIRHKMSNYDSVARTFMHKPGQTSAIRRWHVRVTDEIGKLYPSLRDECLRQIMARASRDTRSIRTWVHGDDD